MSSVLPQTLTANNLSNVPDTGMQYELVRGEVVELMPPGGKPGAIAVALAMVLRLWTKQHTNGYVAVEADYILTYNPDTVRGPDVSYVRSERIPTDGIPEGFWNLTPDLAVEVVSPSETAEDIREKVRDFLMAGTPLVWTIYPRTREVIVHTADGIAQTYGEADVLEFPEMLPGFSCTVAELFA
ncbi:MAG: Uma2 family endonuclease [Chloroflexota bacterium]